MQITFNSHSFTLSVNNEGLFSLKDIEKGWQQSGGKGRRLDTWKDSKDFTTLKTLPEFLVRSVNGGKGIPLEEQGTWGNKFAVIEYASHCSLAFRIAVNQAFEAILV